MTNALKVSILQLWTAYINNQNKVDALRRFLISHQQELNEEGMWENVKTHFDKIRDEYKNDTGVTISFWDYETIQLAHSSLINNDDEMFDYFLKELS